MRAEHHGNIEFHWNGKRRLSAREAARIQTFPDDFIFYPSTSSAYKQIGNAVPPVLGWRIAKAIEEFLDKQLRRKSQRFIHQLPKLRLREKQVTYAQRRRTLEARLI
jgi:hypothetical protein